jgi:hypothetical protein
VNFSIVELLTRIWPSGLKLVGDKIYFPFLSILPFLLLLLIVYSKFDVFVWSFWVELYKCLDTQEMKKRAKEIYDKYCKTDSIYAVNIDWNTQSVSVYITFLLTCVCSKKFLCKFLFSSYKMAGSFLMKPTKWTLRSIVNV